MRTKYIANDGTPFDTSAECLVYEAELTKHKKALTKANMSVHYYDDARKLYKFWKWILLLLPIAVLPKT